MYVSVCVRVVCMRYLQVYVAETLVHTVAFPHLNLQQVIDQVNCCEHKSIHIIITNLNMAVSSE